MENPHVVIETDLGEMLVELYPDKAPITVENFLRYVDEGHYTDTIFHRVIRGFVNQGGGFDRDLNRLPTHEPIKNEADNGLKNEHGTLSMARTMELDSATDQFFINAADNPALDHTDDSIEGFGYAVFGKVVEGLDVVKKINWKVTKNTPMFQDIPAEEIVVRNIRRFE